MTKSKRISVNLIIESDDELRAWIKDQIKQAVISITREEIMQVVMDEVKDTGKSTFRLSNREHLEKFVAQVVTNAVNAGLSRMKVLSIERIEAIAAPVIIASAEAYMKKRFAK